MMSPHKLRPQRLRQRTRSRYCAFADKSEAYVHHDLERVTKLGIVPQHLFSEAPLVTMHLISFFFLLALWQPGRMVSPAIDESWSRTQQAFLPQEDELLGADTVILGAGVIGLATAYQLVLAHREAVKATSRPLGKIVVVEQAARVSPSASGQATGGLVNFGFATGVADLAVLSYELFQQVAFPSGPEEFGFSGSTVYRITPDNFTGTPKPADNWGPASPVEQPISALPDWVRPKKHWSVQRMSGPPHGSHLYVCLLYQDNLD
jgi:hypothetical protein